MYYHTEIFKKVDIIVTPTTGYDEQNLLGTCVGIDYIIMSMRCICTIKVVMHLYLL